MYLSTIQILGFKSYADRVELNLEPGMTGIVGPGGCGKLALLEAVRWAIGQPTPTAFRVESMSDLIFRGSHQRRHMDHATVSLVFSDCPVDWELPGNELRVTRQINRTGDDLHNGQNGQLDAQAVSELLARAGLDSDHLMPAPEDVSAHHGPLLLADLRGPHAARVASDLFTLRERCQIILITDDRTIMAMPECLLGITMEEFGVSKPVAMRLREG